MSSYDRPYRPYSQRERERGPGRRFGRRSEESERGPWGARDPAEFERRYRGGDPYESEEESGGFGEQGFEPSRRRWETEDWRRPERGEFGGEQRWGEGVYGGTPAQQRGWERQERGGYGFEGRGSYGFGSGYGGERYPQGGFEARGGYPQSEPQRGRFAGRGPKGYQRTDERLREDVCDRLMADPDIDAGEITVVVLNGEITLEGSVPDRQTKRDAEDSVEEIPGVRQVHNRLRVESKSDFERSTTGAGGHSEAGASEGQRSTAGRRQGS